MKVVCCCCCCYCMVDVYCRSECKTAADPCHTKCPMQCCSYFMLSLSITSSLTTLFIFVTSCCWCIQRHLLMFSRIDARSSSTTSGVSSLLVYCCAFCCCISWQLAFRPVAISVQFFWLIFPLTRSSRVTVQSIWQERMTHHMCNRQCNNQPVGSCWLIC